MESEKIRKEGGGKETVTCVCVCVCVCVRAAGSRRYVCPKAKDRHRARHGGGRVTTLRVAKRYYTDKNVQCRNCSKNGHLSTNCPEPKKLAPCFLCGNPGHGSNGCPNKHCNNCGLPGHLYNSCSERAHWHKRCERCGMKGHLFDVSTLEGSARM
uniref:Zinc finger CCHC domain-containing protein 7 n=1 Tax=Gasterosteus aculeatus aculeatus TaxID=481459 RepID=A0AAQ4QFK8_GASAC